MFPTVRCLTVTELILILKFNGCDELLSNVWVKLKLQILRKQYQDTYILA